MNLVIHIDVIDLNDFRADTWFIHLASSSDYVKSKPPARFELVRAAVLSKKNLAAGSVAVNRFSNVKGTIRESRLAVYKREHKMSDKGTKSWVMSKNVAVLGVHRHHSTQKKVDARVQRTRDALGDALIALMQEKPFNLITVQEVLDRAD